MTTIRVKGLDRLKDSIKKKLEDATKNRELLDSIAKLVVTATQADSRMGKETGTGDNFKGLEDSTKEHRERLAKFNPTGRFYQGASKANLTFSGQLLDSIKAEIDTGKALVRVWPQGERTPYKNKNGTAFKKTPTNEELAGYLGKDRPFMVIGPKTKKSIVSKVKSFLRKLLR
jgi:phage gpG-like protein